MSISELVYRREVNQMTRDGIEALRYFSESSETDVSDTISRLRDQRKLSSTVRALNGLLSDPAYSAAALLALRRMGLEYGG